MRAIVADDDPDQLGMVATVLEHLGLAVERAASGRELLDHLAADAPFDVVLTDLWMPMMSGAEAIQFARAAGVRGPVVVMTAAHDLSPADQRAIANTDAAVLMKPFTLAQLRTAVKTALASAA